MKGRELHIFTHASDGRRMQFAFKRRATRREFTLDGHNLRSPVLQSLMMWRGDAAMLRLGVLFFLFFARARVCVCLPAFGCDRERAGGRTCVYASETK